MGGWWGGRWGVDPHPSERIRGERRAREEVVGIGLLLSVCRGPQRVPARCFASPPNQFAEGTCRGAAYAANSLVQDRLESVTIQVAHEGCVVARVVGFADPGRALAGSAVTKRGRVERIDRVA